jgi:hypothetical protein
VEAQGEARGSDIAGVRQVPAEGSHVLSHVAVLSSESPTATEGMTEHLQAMKRSLLGEDNDEEPGGEREAKGGAGGDDARGGDGGAASSLPAARPSSDKRPACPLNVNRERDPCSEFENNGLHLMRMFRRTYPLRRYESAVTMNPKGT